MTMWAVRQVPFRFQISDKTLFSCDIRLQVRQVKLTEEVSPQTNPMVPQEPLEEGSEGFVVRGIPIQGEVMPLERQGDFLRYVLLQYAHCYIDLSTTFEEYERKFSAKTRSTINRKIKKFAAHSGGAVSWRTFKRQEEIREFFRLARTVSEKTYQERLLDTGIPSDERYIREAEGLAEKDQVRAYILFDGDKPVSYLYCPVDDGVLIYSYLGYDPEYMQFSVGTILQWKAVEQLFSERQFRYFDFTEGQSEHKRLFATHQRRCAILVFAKISVRNYVVLQSHRVVGNAVQLLGNILERYNLKAKARRLLRFGRAHA